MSRAGLIFSIASLLGFGATAASGKECLGISFPEKDQSETAPLLLNGLGIREATIFKVNVYVAALYLTKTSSDASSILAAPGPYELILHFVRSVDSADIDKAWAEGFSRNSQGQLPALQDRIDTLRTWMPDIKSGQRLKFSFDPGAGLRVAVDSETKGTIRGDDFAKAFLTIWLGVPPNAEIKAGMLGGKCD